VHLPSCHHNEHGKVLNHGHSYNQWPASSGRVQQHSTDCVCTCVGGGAAPRGGGGGGGVSAGL
jgi:hypothetical protein